MVKNTSVISGNAFQALKHDCFPYPKKDETLSQPLQAWKAGKALHISGWRSWINPVTCLYARCLPVPNKPQMSASLLMVMHFFKAPEIMAKMSQSTVLKETRGPVCLRTCMT
eukprot:Lithocolla_globosa_v1_NODE_110_length_6249_cov_6.412002.p5 type:complete len:112 gc:universal NODE_110_length_6249_cov_6.412002:1800-2135(+)